MKAQLISSEKDITRKLVFYSFVTYYRFMMPINSSHQLAHAERFVHSLTCICLISSSRSPGASKELAKRANVKGSQDNITVLVIDFAKYSFLQQSIEQEKEER